MSTPERRAADAATVARMAEGEDRALAELYDRFGGLVYSLTHAILGDAAEAEEAAADAFLQAWSSAGSFDATRASVPGWLSMIARSRALDRLRSRRRREATLAHASASSGDEGFALPLGAGDPPPDRGAELLELRAHVRHALDQLPPPQRRVIELAYYGGLTHSEIALELGEPLGTVKTRIRAAMDKLRSSLGPWLVAG
jgi:RNA polymerase sigma-70 factor (ECF subfamily)